MIAIASQTAPHHLGLQTGPSWSSFEELRVKHSEKLGQIQPGTFGTLKVKQRHFVIVDHSDFARFEEVMQQIQSMLDGLELVQHAARVAETHADESTITMLRATLQNATKTVGNFVSHNLAPFAIEKTAESS
ncbi:hypothetical protein [Deinococcus sp. UR1]|uniref:hypothetical protein n=1 Tax=Deinococcus sp. UR1 TaxID=1704277 RepID=UPI000B23C2DC|nr:hypothetical protein [Deinococcus sp. UR1]